MCDMGVKKKNQKQWFCFGIQLRGSFGTTVIDIAP